MTPSTQQEQPELHTETDIIAEIHRVLASSSEPLTPSKIRARLEAPYRSCSTEELTDCLRRQVAAQVCYQYPKYRSQQDRYWDRAMPVHQAALVRQALEDGPLPWSEIRRRLPAYAQAGAEAETLQQVSQGLLYRHPRPTKRGGDFFGLVPPVPKDYLRPELTELFERLQHLGFTHAQLRAGALELLHEEEWASAPLSDAKSPHSHATENEPQAEP